MGASIKDVHMPRGEGGLPKVYEKCTRGEGFFSNCVRTQGYETFGILNFFGCLGNFPQK